MSLLCQTPGLRYKNSHLHCTQKHFQQQTVQLLSYKGFCTPSCTLFHVSIPPSVQATRLLIFCFGSSHFHKDILTEKEAIYGQDSCLHISCPFLGDYCRRTEQQKGNKYLTKTMPMQQKLWSTFLPYCSGHSKSQNEPQRADKKSPINLEVFSCYSTFASPNVSPTIIAQPMQNLSAYQQPASSMIS